MPNVAPLSINNIIIDEYTKLLNNLKQVQTNTYNKYKKGLDALLQLKVIAAEYGAVNEIGGYKTIPTSVAGNIKNLYSDAIKDFTGIINELDKNKGAKKGVAKLKVYLGYIKNDAKRLENMNPEDKLSLPLTLYKCDQERKYNSAVQGGKKTPSFDEYIRVYSLNLPKGQVAYNFTEETVIEGRLGEEYGRICRGYREKVLNEYVKLTPEKLKEKYERLVRSNPRTYEYEDTDEYDKYNNIDFKVRNTGDVDVISKYLEDNKDRLSFPEKLRLENRILSLKKMEALNKDIEDKMAHGNDYVKYANVKEDYGNGGYDIEIKIPQESYQSSGNGCWSCSSLMMIKSRGINNVTQEDIRAYRPKFGENEQVIDNHNMGQFEAEVHNIDNYNKDEPKGIFEMGDAVLSFAPNNMLREVTIAPLSLEDFTLHNMTKDKYVDNVVKFMEKQIVHSIKEDKSPLSLHTGNHYITIVGITKKNGKLYMKYKDSLPGVNTHPDKVYEVDLKDYIGKNFYNGNVPANFRGITLTWMSKIELAKDGHTIHGIPSEYVYMKDDGTLSLQPEEYRVFSQADKLDTNREGIRIYRGSGNEEAVVDNNISTFTKDGIKTTERVYIKPKLNPTFLKDMASKRSDEEEKRLYNIDRDYYDLKGDKRAKDDPAARKAIDDYHKKYGVKNAIKVNVDLKNAKPVLEKVKDNKKRYVDDSSIKTGKKTVNKMFVKQLNVAKEMIEEDKKRQLEDQISFNKTNQAKRHEERMKAERKRVKPFKDNGRPLSGEEFTKSVQKSYDKQNTSLDKMMYVLNLYATDSVNYGIIHNALHITDENHKHEQFNANEIAALIVNNKPAIESLNKDINDACNVFMDEIKNRPLKEIYMIVGMVNAKLSMDMIDERRKMLKNRDLLRGEPDREAKIDYILKKRDALPAKAIYTAMSSFRNKYLSDVSDKLDVIIDSGVDERGILPDFVVNPELLRNMTIKEYFDKIGLDKERLDNFVLSFKHDDNQKVTAESNAYSVFRNGFVTSYVPTSPEAALHKLSDNEFNVKFRKFLYNDLYLNCIIDQYKSIGEKMYLNTLSEEDKKMYPKGSDLLNDMTAYSKPILEWRKNKDTDILVGQYRVEDANKMVESFISQTYGEKSLGMTSSKESKYSKLYSNLSSNRKTFGNYIKLHSGFDAVKGDYDEVRTNLAKCFAATNMKNDKQEFSVKNIRKAAEKIKNSVSFKKLDNQDINKAFRDLKYLDELNSRIMREEELIKNLTDALKGVNKNLDEAALKESNPDKMIDGKKGALDADKAALNYVTKQYLIEARKSSTGVKELTDLVNKVKNGEFKKSVDKLAHNKAFKMVVKDSPKDYYSAWNEGKDKLKTCVEAWKEGVSGVDDITEQIKGINNPNVQYEMLADYVLKQILTEPGNERVGMAIVTDKLSYRDALNATKKKLQDMGTINQVANEPVNWDWIKKNIEDGTLKDNVAESLSEIAKDAKRPDKFETKKNVTKKAVKNSGVGMGAK